MKRTIPEFLRRTVEQVPDKTWLLASDGGRFTYAQALERVERAASWFRAAGVGPGDRVLVTARNTPDYLWTWLALMEVGAIWVAVNPAGTDDELAGLWRLDREFLPAISRDEAETRMAGWRRAVERSRDWAQA